MIKNYIIIFLIPLLGFNQANYNITINNTNAWQGNLFFQLGGAPANPVKAPEIANDKAL